MGKTISFVKGKGSVAHNNRDFIAANVDKNRTDWNVTYMCQPLREAYDECFGAALKEYNDKQKRNDRKKDDYMNEIKNSKNGEKLFYENVVQIGKMTDTGVLDENGELSESAKLAMEVLDEYARTFQERNPNLYVFNSVLHMDEATPHLHIDYIPVAHGYKKGMSTRNSLTKAYQEMGIESAVSKKDNETVHWQIKERAYLEELCHEKGIEIETIGIDRDNYTLPEYKAAMKAIEDKEAEIEILNTQIAETEAIINGFDNLKAENEDQIKEQEEYLKQVKEDVEKSQKQLDTIKERNRIFGDADKVTKKEISDIAKKVEPTLNLLGGPEMVKLPKKVWNKVFEYFKSAKTVEAVTSFYEDIIRRKDRMIESLKSKADEAGEYKSLVEEYLKYEGKAEDFEDYSHNRIKRIMEYKKQEMSKQSIEVEPNVKKRKHELDR